MTTTAVHVLDDYYLGITALITVAYQLVFFAIAFTLQFDKLTDFAGGTNFAILAIVTLSLSSSSSDSDIHTRQIIVSLFLIIWALRLSGFLLFRIVKTGKDDRFDGMRDKFLPFLGFWLFQMLWVWTVSLPQHEFGTGSSSSSSSSGRDIAGVVLYVLGLTLEVVSDAQRYRFRSTHDGKAVCDKGLFALSRHPNYFGEIVLHFSIYMIAVSPAAADGLVRGQARNALYATILGPMFITFLLLFVSGLPLGERPKAKSRYDGNNNWETYKRWLDRTSILVPFPPQLYEKLPTILKRTVFLEFPMYVFDPAKHSDAAAAAAAESGGGAAINTTTNTAAAVVATAATATETTDQMQMKMRR
ncbi:hypothetical protein PT974_06312 [Cladobotryum mycophilum]|uniref:Steroid 5-alpha reductase C-terminal domain-containing protein n=1 Tax=Cladobotryum mycophilum TaxID=491253 RepID=A0ABR0SL41_9HYPO